VVLISEVKQISGANIGPEAVGLACVAAGEILPIKKLKDNLYNY